MTLALEQLRRRGMISSFAHPKAGDVRTLGDPMLRRDPRPPPLLGQHTEEVLRGIAGLSAADVATLRDAGVVRFA